MAAVDVGSWQEFRVGDLFDVSYGTFRDKIEISNEYDSDHSFPHITTTDRNNGIGGYAPTHMFPGNCLTVASDGNQGATFYQASPFSCSNIVSALVPKDSSTFNELVGNFIATLLRQEGTHYSCSGYKFSVNRVRETRLMLPATPDGQPDWAYMEAYMGSVMERQAAVVDALSRMATEKRPVDVGSWVEFDLIGKDGIFKEYERGKVSAVRDLSDGDTPYVGAVFPKNNNGVQRYVTPKSEGQVTKGNCLVMVCDGAAIGCNMYQPSDFVGTTNLKIVRNEHLNELTGLFLASALDASARRSGYSYFWKRNDENIRKEKIKLPATPDGKPDWAFMESYMRKVMNRQEHVVEVLSCICKH